jgi:hypothetical protein
VASTVLKVDVRVGETIRVSGKQGSVVIMLRAKSGQRARLAIEADESFSIDLPDERENVISRGLLRPKAV